MVSYKVLLDERRPKKGGTFNIIIRITHNRRVNTLNTNISIEKEFWDTTSNCVGNAHPNSALINKSITEFYLKIQKAILLLDDEDGYSIEALKEKLLEQSKPSKINTGTTFNEFSQKVIQELYAINKTGNAIVYQTGSNRLLDFVKNRNLKFKDIDYNLLEAFRQHLVKDGVKQNTIGNYFRTIRAIYNRAIKAKLIDRAYYPFQEISIKSERTAKRAVLIGDLKRVYQLQLKPGSREWHARNYFFLSFSLRGISFTDMAYLKPTNISRGVITYRRRKTHKEYAIQLSEFAKEILNSYASRNSKYLLPVVPESITEDSFKAKSLIAQWIKTSNKWLKKLGAKCDIEEPITTYVARHTWATTAKRLGYSNELIAEALGHEYGNKITNIYLDSFDQSVIDELNEKVIQGIL
jgi:site-specific recombinase XerD